MMKSKSTIATCVGLAAGLLALAGQTAQAGSLTSINVMCQSGAEIEAILGSPAAQLPLNDPLLQKALELLQDDQVRTNRKEQRLKQPDGPIGESAGKQNRRTLDVDHRLILGGPDILPM